MWVFEYPWCLYVLYNIVYLYFVTYFYDTQLTSSLIPIRARQERWDHRMQNISSEDLSAFDQTIGTV